MSYNFEELNKRLNMEIRTIFQQEIIKYIVDRIIREYLNISLFLFGGALRDIVANDRINDYDIFIIGGRGELNYLKRMIQQKFGKSVGYDYFGGDNTKPTNGLDVVSFDGYGWNLSFDFVFATDIPDRIWDFDTNIMTLLLDPGKSYSWKDIRLDLGKSNQRLKRLIRQIVEKRCCPTPHIIGGSQAGDELDNSIHQLYRFAKMLNKGYQIEHDEWEYIVVNKFNMLKNSLFELGLTTFDSDQWIFTKMNELQQNKNYQTIQRSLPRIRYIENALKKYCINHITNVSIAFIPLELPIYVQHWILEYEFPLANCLTQFDRIECLEKIEKSRGNVITWRKREPEQSWMSLQTFMYRQNNQDDDDY